MYEPRLTVSPRNTSAKLLDLPQRILNLGLHLATRNSIPIRAILPVITRIFVAQHLHLLHDVLQLPYFSQQDTLHQELLVLVFEIEDADLEGDGFHSAVGGVRTRAGWGGLTIGSSVIIIRAGGARPGFGLVLGGDDEAVPEEDFGGDGHVKEGEVRLLDTGRVEQFLEGADGGAVEVENFVERGHAVGDLSEPRARACQRLL